MDCVKLSCHNQPPNMASKLFNRCEIFVWGNKAENGDDFFQIVATLREDLDTASICELEFLLSLTNHSNMVSVSLLNHDIYCPPHGDSCAWLVRHRLGMRGSTHQDSPMSDIFL